LGPAQVEVRLGAPWIPVDVVTQFSQELVNANEGVITVAYDSTTATWSVKGGYRLEYVGDRTLQTVKWGTSSRCALTLVEAALNQQPPTVTVTVDGKSCTDPVATMNAREKWQAIRDHFRQWVYQDEDRRDRLLRIYNDAFNQIVTRRFDGSHLQLPGLSASVIPYQHQLDAIWRIVMNGNTLLAHCVGAGKTLTMIAAGMEMRRLGKARKPCHVVPNHLLADYVGEVKRFYPQSRVLMATKEDVNGDKRRTFVARVATGDWDAVVMTMSTFERLMPSIEKQQGFIDSMLAEARMMLNLTKDRGAQRTIKELERRMKDYEAKLTRLVENGKADEKAFWFDELGIDALFIDEAHALKNLGRMSKMPRIAGLPNVASQRAFDAFMKTRMIMEARGGAEEGVVFATATPVTNSLAELYTMQVFLQPKTLKKYGVYEFDAWSASFGESVTGIELSPDGGGFRTNTRYARFVNLPELMGIFRGVADVRTKKMLNLPTPTIEGGKPQTMVAKSSDALKAITAELVERAEKIRGGSVEPSVDNMLSVTNDGRRAALDVRMVDPRKPADPQGKLAMVVSNVHRIWESGSQERLTQLVFCDLGTPGAPGFSVYEEIRRGLLDKGIPLSEIEFIHDHDSDAAKAKLFKRVRTGQVRVLMGSTQKLGTGTNVQRLLKAVHQVDAPWVPSSVEQRDGRADRQGNECASIELWRYVTEGSFDAYSWNLLDVKSRFIDQVMTADQGLRSVEDISMTALTYAEIKAIASGNPLVLEKATVDAKVQKLSLQLDHWEQDRWRMSRRKVELTQRLGWIDANMASIEQEKELAKAVLANAVFKPGSAVAKDAVHEHMLREMAIGQAFAAMAKARTHGVMGSLNGFKLETERVFNVSELYVVSPLTGTAVLVDRPAMNMHADVGHAVLKTVAEFEKRVASLMDEYGRKVQERNGIESMLGQAFEHGQELEQARVRQRQIEAELDLDKSATGSDAMTAEAA